MYIISTSVELEAKYGCVCTLHNTEIKRRALIMPEADRLLLVIME